MTLNPIIEFVYNTVEVLTVAGWGFILLAIAFMAVRTVLREWPTLYVMWKDERLSNKWWAFGDRRAGYIPPLMWSVRLALSFVVLAVAAFAMAALVQYVGGA